MFDLIGCDILRMLEAACQNHGGTNNVVKSLQNNSSEESKEGEIAALFEEFLIHNKASVEKKSLEKMVICTEFGDRSDAIRMVLKNVFKTRQREVHRFPGKRF